MIGVNTNKWFYKSDIAFLILVILIGGSTSYNLPVYENAYSSPLGMEDFTGNEWLYSIFVEVFKSWDVSFRVFFLIMQTAGLLLIRSVANKYLTNAGVLLFYLLMFIYPLGEIKSAFRNGLAAYLVTFALPFLLSGKKKDIIKYIFLIFFASGFHRTALIYIIFLCKPLYDKQKPSIQKTCRIIFMSFILVCFVIAFNPFFISLIQPILSQLMDSEEMEIRLFYLEVAGNMGFVIYSSFQLILMFILRKMNTPIGGSNNRFVEMIIFADFILLFLVVGYKMNSNFFRLFYNLLPLNYIAIISLKNAIKKNKQIYYIAIITIIAFGIFQEYHYWDENILSSFNNNWILSGK